MSKNNKTEAVSSFGTLVRSDDVDDDAQDEEEEDQDGGVWFYVNKSGFPMDEFTYKRMWDHVAKQHPDSFGMVHKVKGKNNQEVPIPQAPLSFPSNSPVYEKLDIVQKYMSELQYNHTGTQFYEIRKNRPISGLMDTAKDMIKESLPIKCLEAVILALYLTNGISGLDRFPLSFRTVFNHATYNHVVLAVYYNGYYGSLGMSRRHDLMHKPLKFKSLSEMVLNFKQAYNNYWHEVKKVAVGIPVAHDPHSYGHISWRALNLHTRKHSWVNICRELDRHARDIKVQVKCVGACDSSPGQHTVRQRTNVAASKALTDSKHAVSRSHGSKKSSKGKRRPSRSSGGRQKAGEAHSSEGEEWEDAKPSAEEQSGKESGNSSSSSPVHTSKLANFQMRI